MGAVALTSAFDRKDKDSLNQNTLVYKKERQHPFKVSVYSAV